MINRNIARIICVMISVIIMIGACGCMKKDKLSVDNCLEYMKNKYDEEFEYSGPYDDFQPTSRTLKIFVKNKKYPDSEILVIEEKNGEGTVCHDNYVAIKYEKDVIDLFKNVAAEIYGECRVIYSVDDIFYLSDSFDNSTVFTEYTSKQSSNISVSVLLPPDHNREFKENELNQVYQKLCENSMVCTFNVYYVNNTELYGSLNSEEEMMLESEWYDHKGQLVIDDDYSIETEMWR